MQPPSDSLFVTHLNGKLYLHPRKSQFLLPDKIGLEPSTHPTRGRSGSRMRSNNKIQHHLNPFLSSERETNLRIERTFLHFSRLRGARHQLTNLVCLQLCFIRRKVQPNVLDGQIVVKHSYPSSHASRAMHSPSTPATCRPACGKSISLWPRFL